MEQNSITEFEKAVNGVLDLIDADITEDGERKGTATQAGIAINEICSIVGALARGRTTWEQNGQNLIDGWNYVSRLLASLGHDTTEEGEALSDVMDDVTSPSFWIGGEGV